MTLRPRLQVIEKDDFERIHAASLKILKQTGVVFHDEDALAILKRHGAKVNNKIVHFSEKIIEKALESAPSKFKWYARNEDSSLNVGDGERVAIQPNIGPVNIKDSESGAIPASLKDFINIQKICQASSVINVTGGNPVDPADIEPSKRHLMMMYETIKNTDKPMVSYTVRDLYQANEVLDMTEIAMGQKKFLELNHCIGASVTPLSPLTWGPDSLQMIMAYSKRNQIVFLPPAPMAGITGPISLIGTTVLQNTEILSGIVLAQLINPGSPVVYAVSASPGYLKSGRFVGGSPEMMMINIPGLQMGKDFYKLPVRTMCGITDSHDIDCQAGYETMQNIMGGILGGADIILESLGVLDSVMTTSYEKMIIDEEIISRVLRIREGVDTSDIESSIDVIQEIAHNGNYLVHQTTLENFRKRWVPTISNWDGKSDNLIQKANRKYKEILKNAPESLIDSELDKELLNYMESTFRRQ